MYPWQIALAAALPALAVPLFLLILYRLFCYRQQVSLDISRNLTRLASKKTRDPFDSALRHGNRVASAWRTTYPIRPFDWSENPGLIAEAVEHGWATFAFSYTCSTCPKPTNLWDMCRGCSHREDYEPEISWEMWEGSDYLQKIWLNPGLPIKKENAASHVQALQATLPLPGPPLNLYSFPQEGYFEITILAEGREHNGDHASNGSFTDSEHVKLISKHFLSGKHFVSELTANYPNQRFEKEAEQDDHKRFEGNGLNPDKKIELNSFSRKQTAPSDCLSADQFQAMAVGLAAGGAPPFRLPGCDPGSVGLRTNGQVYLNGALDVEQEPRAPLLKRSWGAVNTTVGCGFDPTARKVFFTVNGECVHELTACSGEFGNPLYPIIAANYDVTVLANFGQVPFGYAPADAHRIPDPSFRRPYSRSTKNSSVNDDSGDLFSMGRIDSQWLTGTESPCSDDVQHRHVFSEAESDLFEIVLDARN